MKLTKITPLYVSGLKHFFMDTLVDGWDVEVISGIKLKDLKTAPLKAGASIPFNELMHPAQALRESGEWPTIANQASSERLMASIDQNTMSIERVYLVRPRSDMVYVCDVRPDTGAKFSPIFQGRALVLNSGMATMNCSYDFSSSLDDRTTQTDGLVLKFQLHLKAGLVMYGQGVGQLLVEKKPDSPLITYTGVTDFRGQDVQIPNERLLQLINKFNQLELAGYDLAAYLKPA